MKNTETPRVLARLTAEELEQVNGGGSRCPLHKTTDLDGQPDTGGYTIDLSNGACD